MVEIWPPTPSRQPGYAHDKLMDQRVVAYDMIDRGCASPSTDNQAAAGGAGLGNAEWRRRGWPNPFGDCGCDNFTMAHKLAERLDQLRGEPHRPDRPPWAGWSPASLLKAARLTTGRVRAYRPLPGAGDAASRARPCPHHGPRHDAWYRGADFRRLVADPPIRPATSSFPRPANGPGHQQPRLDGPRRLRPGNGEQLGLRPDPSTGPADDDVLSRGRHTDGSATSTSPVPVTDRDAPTSPLPRPAG
jgi:hypothetical protein